MDIQVIRDRQRTLGELDPSTSATVEMVKAIYKNVVELFLEMGIGITDDELQSVLDAMNLPDHVAKRGVFALNDRLVQLTQMIPGGDNIADELDEMSEQIMETGCKIHERTDPKVTVTDLLEINQHLLRLAEKAIHWKESNQLNIQEIRDRQKDLDRMKASHLATVGMLQTIYTNLIQLFVSTGYGKFALHYKGQKLDKVEGSRLATDDIQQAVYSGMHLLASHCLRLSHNNTAIQEIYTLIRDRWREYNSRETEIQTVTIAELRELNQNLLNLVEEAFAKKLMIFPPKDQERS